MTKLFFVLLFFSTASYGQDNWLNNAVYEETKRIAFEILEHCNSPDCLIVGVGRSPTVVTTFLKQVGAKVTDLPISLFRYHPDKKPGSPPSWGGTSYIEYALDLQQEAALFNYFENWLNLKGIKNLILVDYVNMGLSLYSIESYLKRFLRQKNMAIDIQPIGISNPNNQYHFETVYNSHPIFIYLNEAIETHGDAPSNQRSTLSQLIGSAFIDKYAEYELFPLFKIMQGNLPKVSTFQGKHYISTEMNRLIRADIELPTQIKKFKKKQNLLSSLFSSAAKICGDLLSGPNSR